MSSINDQASDSDSDHGHGQSSEMSGKTRPVRAKVPTSKGYICNRLRDKQTACLSAVTKKRTEITWLMTDYNDLHLVKSALDDMNNLFIEYQNAHREYLDVLTLQENQ